MEKIIIKGAREHNLKNVSLELPRNAFNVITGLSGSGKSSLAFDTIYAEGQRRYVESLSAYARQFLGQMQKPDVDSIEGLSPAISIEQKTIQKNPRSTVGTITEIFDYLRLLYARIGHPHCPKCGRPITRQSASSVIKQIFSLKEGSKVVLLAPLVEGRKGEYRKVIEEIRRQGFGRIRLDGEMIELQSTPDIKMDKNRKHTLEAVVDRIIIRPDGRKRLADSVETGLKLGEGRLIANYDGQDHVFSQHLACAHCGVSYGELSPRLFSFNSPFGACPVCTGLGVKMQIDPKLLIPDPSLSLSGGAVRFFGMRESGYFYSLLKTLSKEYKFSVDTPFKELSQKIRNIILYGSSDKIRFQYNSDRFKGEYFSKWEGLVNNMQRRYKQTNSQMMREEIERYMSETPCGECGGLRLKKEALSVTIDGRHIIEVCALAVRDSAAWFRKLPESLTAKEKEIARLVLKEVLERLSFLEDVGLGYLTLERRAGTISGGEAQRIRLATQIGSRLVGVTYILDEPSIGLHQKDNRKLLDSLVKLRDLGNTLVVIEHDEETIRSADFVVDMGPGAGEKGGEVVAAGTIKEICATPRSLTGQYLSGRERIETPPHRREGNGKKLVLRGCREHNLKDIDVAIPLGKLVSITGVSGSGKSTLINDILFPELNRLVNRVPSFGGAHDKLEGAEHIDKVICIDQSAIGRTPRSNPATYTGVFTPIRDLFTNLPDSKMRGYEPGRFSFNVPGGRCETCAGDGVLRIEMHFLPDVYVPCEECKGRRFNDETLEIRYKGKNIADILDMSVEEALAFFENIPAVRSKLSTLHDVGLGYIRLGQSATTFSGGEAQRIKLASELSRRSTGRTLYLLDEPTTGLHFADIRQLIEVLNRFVDGGNTVVVIEHNLDVIRTSDHIVDLGPEGGDLGGRVVASGTPEQLARAAESATGSYLKTILSRR
jgi:excinuclease ABC subunit A